MQLDSLALPVLVGVGAAASIARSLSPAGATWTSDQVLAVLPRGGPIVAALGEKQLRGEPFFDIAVSDPSVLRRWGSSRGTTPAAREQRAFAKLALSLLEA